MSARVPTNQSVRLGLSLLASLLLAGCAGQMAFRDGKEFVAQNKVEEGLQKFQQAVNEDPRSPVFRAALSQTRERMINTLLVEAEQLAQAQPDQARQRYQRVLAIEHDNSRALEGIKLLNRAQRHALWLQDANALQLKKDIVGAKAKLSLILLENPNHQTAQQALRALNEANTPPSAQAQLAQVNRKPITIDFRDATLKQVFDVIARTAGLNILFDKDVRQDQRMSIILKNSTIEAALHYAMLTNQLDLQVLDGNTILVYPNQPAKQKDYQEIVVRSFFLANADAKTVANSLKTITKTRDIVADEKLNMIIIRDSPEAVRMAEKLVALHDQAEPEVMLEVEILEIKRTRLLQLGIKWPDSLTLTTLPSTTGGQLTLSDLRRNINSRTLGANALSATAKFGETDSDVNLLANPRIRARNHEKAKILIGERVPTITSTATSNYVSESVNYLDVGLKLEVEPTIFLDGDVAIKVALEVSNIVSEAQTKSGTSVYRIGNRSASTVLRLKDGENQVLAGLINNEERRSASKLPGIGELPVVGRLFGSADDNNEKTEIVLSITPRLIRNIQRPDATVAEFRAGTDGSMRVRPESGGGLTILPATSAPTAANSGTSASSISNNSGSGNNSGSNSGNSGASGATPITPSLAGTGATNNLETGVAAPAPAQPQLQWQGPPNVKAGDAFAVQLVMRSDQAIASVPLTVKYDAKVLQVTGVTEGDFLKHGGAQTSFSSKIDPSGLVIVSGTRNSAGGATDSGAIATLTFRALAATDATLLQLLDFTPVTANGLSPVVNKPAPFTLQVRP